jgi:hypothetical protein
MGSKWLKLGLYSERASGGVPGELVLHRSFRCSLMVASVAADMTTT